MTTPTKDLWSALARVRDHQPQTNAMAVETLQAAHQMELCACGQYKGPGGLIVCGECWYRVPHEIRHQVQFGSWRAKRIAAQLVLGFARARQHDPEAQFAMMEGWRGGPRPHVRD